MLEILNGFRNTISEIMLKALKKRVVLYGYGYTGRFLKWYAQYYHGIEVDYTVTQNLPYSQSYDLEVFLPSVFEFSYKDIKECFVWLAVPQTEGIRSFMESLGFVEGETYFDFYKAIYGEDIVGTQEETDIFHKKKTGQRDIQFMEWLEWKYDCNFLTAITVDEMNVVGEGSNSYRVTTQKEHFEILDNFHIMPTSGDAIFDFGCGKGGAIVSFLDYGFERAGGIEYEPGIFEAYRDNMDKLGLQGRVLCLQGDATKVGVEIDGFNHFYFFAPFNGKLFEECFERIKDSLKRHPRDAKIIYINPGMGDFIENDGTFQLIKQIAIPMRNRVVDLFEHRMEK